LSEGGINRADVTLHPVPHMYPWDVEAARGFPEIDKITKTSEENKQGQRFFRSSDVAYCAAPSLNEVELASRIFVAQHDRAGSDQLLAQEALAAARAFLEEAGTSRP
jgi:hypothetical protein